MLARNQMYSIRTNTSSNIWTKNRIDNYAVIQMCCELLSITWSGDSIKLKAISEAVKTEDKDDISGYENLSRFKSTIEKLFADLDVPIQVFGYISSGEPVTIYPDNGKLYVKLELGFDNDPEKVKVIFTGVGGSLTTLFSPASLRFTKFNNLFSSMFITKFITKCMRVYRIPLRIP